MFCKSTHVQHPPRAIWFRGDLTNRFCYLFALSPEFENYILTHNFIVSIIESIINDEEDYQVPGEQRILVTADQGFNTRTGEAIEDGKTATRNDDTIIVSENSHTTGSVLGGRGGINTLEPSENSVSPGLC